MMNILIKKKIKNKTKQNKNKKQNKKQKTKQKTKKTFNHNLYTCKLLCYCLVIRL